MTNIKVSVKQDATKGEGKLLYLVTMVDPENPEFISVQLWRANDEDHLYAQNLADFTSTNPETVEEIFYMEIWTEYWVPRFIGIIEP
jgi:hypothetical protein